MPELVEVEAYRRRAEAVVGRTVEDVYAPDAWYLKRGLTAPGAVAALQGATVTAARRRGKLLILDTDGGPTVGLRFGMSGRLVVDGQAAIGKLLSSGAEVVERWDRFALRFAPPAGGDLRMQDPRRLGGVELDPPEGALGPDAATATPGELRLALRGSGSPLKARLMDQARLAGVGNLAADEILWRAGLDPARPAGALTSAEARRLHRHLLGTLADLAGRGGSHLGDLQPQRVAGGRCPRDGTALVRRTIGGRTTWSCPAHQV